MKLFGTKIKFVGHTNQEDAYYHCSKEHGMKKGQVMWAKNLWVVIKFILE